MTPGACTHYTSDRLALRPDVDGARMWAVALERAMLTYFELDAGCRFDTHAHEAEQITLVLEGTLYFETDAGTTVVAAGEVFAIPSRTPHAVFTRDEHVRAVDAWSPIRPELLDFVGET